MPLFKPIDRAELLRLGRRCPTGYLVEQAGVLLELVKQDWPSLSSVLPGDFPEQFGAALAAVEQDSQEMALCRSQAKEATAAQNRDMREARIWLRRAVLRCQSAARIGGDVPAPLLRAPVIKSLPGLLKTVEEFTALLGSRPGMLPGSGAAELAAEGLKIAERLREADSAQEVLRGKTSPDATLKFYLDKGRLYNLAKMAILAGRSIHADAPDTARAYSLEVYNRSRQGWKKGERKGKAVVK